MVGWQFLMQCCLEGHTEWVLLLTFTWWDFPHISPPPSVFNEMINFGNIQSTWIFYNIKKLSADIKFTQNNNKVFLIKHWNVISDHSKSSWFFWFRAWSKNLYLKPIRLTRVGWFSCTPKDLTLLPGFSHTVCHSKCESRLESMSQWISVTSLKQGTCFNRPWSLQLIHLFVVAKWTHWMSRATNAPYSVPAAHWYWPDTTQSLITCAVSGLTIVQATCRW